VSSAKQINELMLKIRRINEEGGCDIPLERAYGVLLVTQGAGNLLLDGDPSRALDGRVFFFKDLDYLSFEGSLLNAYLVEFPELMMVAFLVHFVTHREKGLFHSNVISAYADLEPGEQQFLLNMITRLEDELERKTSPFIFKYILFVLLRHINRGVEKDAVMTPYQERLFTKLMILIAKHCRETRKTSFYAEQLELKDEELNDFSRQVFGKRFFYVLMEHLITEADLLLINTEMTVKEIAFDLGFGSPSKFSACYSEYKGCTPKEFRKTNGK
jgi:AraC-like DNA-binding protein